MLKTIRSLQTDKKFSKAAEICGVLVHGKLDEKAPESQPLTAQSHPPYPEPEC